MRVQRGAAGARSFDPERVRFVLIEPQQAGNVGASARALKNFGFSRLDLVRPACDPSSEQARMMAVDARDLLERAGRHDDLDAALDGARTVIGTTARTGKQRRPHWRLDTFADELATLCDAGGLAVVFGREDHGLTDTQLDRCTHLVHLPAAETYTSLNLAQAVLLVAYELRLVTLQPLPPDDRVAPADHATREAFYGHLEQALRAIGFVTPDTSESIMRRMRRLFGRARLSADDAQMFRGLARQILWAARQARLPIPPDPP